MTHLSTDCQVERRVEKEDKLGMEVGEKRVGVRGSVVAAGSVWESRMKSDEVRGGIKVLYSMTTVTEWRRGVCFSPIWVMKCKLEFISCGLLRTGMKLLRSGSSGGTGCFLIWLRSRREWRREREREKGLWNFGAEWGERVLLFGFKKKAFLFSYYFILSYATCLHLCGAKKGPLFFWCDPYTATGSEKKNLTFEMLKSYLGLRAVSLVLVLRVSLRPSGPVFFK